MTRTTTLAAAVSAAMPEDDGYIPAHQRWARLLGDYPPKEGWATRVTASVAATPLFYAGTTTPAPTMLFEATLAHPGGTVVATGSTLFVVDSPRDWESAETNARNRLLIALGYAPRAMADDEARTAEQRPFTPQANALPPASKPTGKARTKPAATLVVAPATAIDEDDPFTGIGLVSADHQEPRDYGKPLGNPFDPAPPASPTDAETVVAVAEPAAGPEDAPAVAQAADPAPASRAQATSASAAKPSPAINPALVQAVIDTGKPVDWSVVTTDEAVVRWFQDSAQVVA